MMTPHDTAQYGHVLRVSVVRAILSSRISARALFRSNPSAAPPLTTAPNFKKVRRFTGHLRRFEHQVTVPRSCQGNLAATLHARIGCFSTLSATPETIALSDFRAPNAMSKAKTTDRSVVFAFDIAFGARKSD